MKRRKFLRNIAAISIGVSVVKPNIFGANDKVQIGFIGLGNRGDQVLDAILPHQDVAITRYVIYTNHILTLPQKRLAEIQNGLKTTDNCLNKKMLMPS
jgi:hypothetical protein